jgi:CheY-like chemotaxis protein
MSTKDDDDLNFVPEDPEEDRLIAEGEKWNILVVDDDPEVHKTDKLSFSVLTIHGRKINMRSAYTGEEAISLLSDPQNDFHLVFLDSFMGTEDAGDKVAEYVKDVLHKTIPVIVMISGYESGHHPKVDEFVPKTKSGIEVTRALLCKWLPVPQ